MDPNLQRLAGATLLWVGELAGSPRAPGAPPCRAKGQGNERLRGTFKETPSLQPLDRFRSLLVPHCGWSLLKASHQASLVLFKILPSPQSQSTPSIPGVRGLLIFSPSSFPVHHNPPTLNLWGVGRTTLCSWPVPGARVLESGCDGRANRCPVCTFVSFSRCGGRKGTSRRHSPHSL